jgi:organic hydroperoxide reductase OsmC/OhrA
MPIHEYKVNVSWQGGRDGQGRLEAPESGESFPLAVPAEFGGPGGATNPEELLTSAIASC